MMMMRIESALAVRFPAGANFCSSSALHHYRPTCSSDEVTCCHVTSRRLFRRGGFDLTWDRFRRINSGSLLRRTLIKNKIRATAEHLGSASDPTKQNRRPHYHPFEDIGEATSKNSNDAILSAAETTRTIIKVNSKATLMFTGIINDEVHENIMWPDLPYVTDEHGNVYFQVKSDEDIMQSLTLENNFVQVIIGFDTTEIMKEIELSGPSDIDFGIEEIEDEDSDVEDVDEDEDDHAEEEDYDEEWVAALEHEDDQDDSDETLGDWAKLETMRSSHPMYFAKKLTEVASDDPIDWMEQPSDGLAIQGLIRPAFVEEHSEIQKHMSSNQSRSSDTSQVEKVVEDKLEDLGIINGQSNELGWSGDSSTISEEPEKKEISINGSSFYKLEIVKIQLITAHGHQTVVELEDFKQAQPDAIAQSAAKIISCLKAGGEKTTQALKSLCWRCKSIQVEVKNKKVKVMKSIGCMKVCYLDVELQPFYLTMLC
ncbi:Pentatricopeptide repeat superfamily protein, putative isoform 3 [Theobroma cacao]|uniref:Pentatricopeptide repeat superfamily protein, putative isoform 3 n=1 Tax=Theobroma cacao TaxID=3641 RepID=A0A061G2A6_THECC|nr:Pentatricopeptide repeat superfamily protein, putative isoform 3 [Theobroma cacao]